jgi:hypothetical protein
MLGLETYKNHSHVQQIFCHTDVLGVYMIGNRYFPNHNLLLDLRFYVIQN